MCVVKLVRSDEGKKGEARVSPPEQALPEKGSFVAGWLAGDIGLTYI